ncbi:hypothetical protein [Parvibaculum sp.]|uniref:hypothetical protein n=1 Tax=Parvibaculum sp. TaxID=2024848 RepID=UPI002611CB39|nr:hypothetical protein [Parvibaculum sp.]MCW5727251.1 hypothetical protein [Parvibaculum sp.]
MGLRLDVPLEPRWIALGFGIECKVRPLSSATVASVQAKAARLAREMMTAAEAEKLAGLVEAKDLSEDDLRAGLTEMYLAIVLGQATIMEWTGFFDRPGRAAAVTDDNIAAAMRLPLVGPRFVGEFFRPYAPLVEEGNGSALPQPGSMTAAPITAGAAEPSAPIPASSAATARRRSKARTAPKAAPR